MAATTATKTGVSDSAAGAGVNEYLGLQGPLAALIQGMSVIPIGDPWQIKGSLSFTPTLISDTLPPSPVLAWKVPAGKSLLFTGGVVHGLAAATEYVRVCRRYFLFGYQATAAPSAPVAPTAVVAAGTNGIGTAGSFLYKVAPIDTFRKEGPLSAATGAITLTSTNQCVSVTPPALASGAIGYNIYRTLNGGATYFYVGTTFGITAYLDAQPDSALDQTLVPGGTTWATGAIAGETMDGPGEVIIEVGAVALTGAPTSLIYTGAYGAARQMVAGTFPTTVGARLRFKPFGETSNFIAVATVTNNAWRGPYADARDRHEEDLGVTSVNGVNAVPSAGSFMVFGQQVIGVHDREEATAAIKAKRIVSTLPHGVLLPPQSEIVCEIGALALGVAGVRDVALSGLILPTAGT